MRFLFGIIIGAVITLFVATAMDAPTHPILDRVQGTLHQVWDRLINSTSDSLFDDADSQAADAESLLEDLKQQKRLTLSSRESNETLMADSVPSTTLPAALPATALSPATALTAPASVDAPPPVDVVRASKPAGTAAASEPAVLPDEPPDERADFRPDTAIAFGALTAAAEPVWVPFHSHMSAEGFAARLSRELEHEFRVERQAAGAYQVVFNATDPREREALLAQISEITGQ